MHDTLPSLIDTCIQRRRLQHIHCTDLSLSSSASSSFVNACELQWVDPFEWISSWPPPPPSSCRLHCQCWFLGLFYYHLPSVGLIVGCPAASFVHLPKYRFHAQSTQTGHSHIPMYNNCTVRTVRQEFCVECIECHMCISILLLLSSFIVICAVVFGAICVVWLGIWVEWIFCK